MEILILGIGILIGIVLMGVLRLLSLSNHITFLPEILAHKGQAEILLPESSPDDIADQIVNHQDSSTGINPLS